MFGLVDAGLVDPSTSSRSLVSLPSVWKAMDGNPFTRKSIKTCSQPVILFSKLRCPK